MLGMALAPLTHMNPILGAGLVQELGKPCTRLQVLLVSTRARVGCGLDQKGQAKFSTHTGMHGSQDRVWATPG